VSVLGVFLIAATSGIWLAFWIASIFDKDFRDFTLWAMTLWIPLLWRHDVYRRVWR